MNGWMDGCKDTLVDLFTFVPIYLAKIGGSIYLPICLYEWIDGCIHAWVNLSTYVFIHLPTYLPRCMGESIYLSIYLAKMGGSVYLPICPYGCIDGCIDVIQYGWVYFLVYLSTYLSAYMIGQVDAYMHGWICLLLCPSTLPR